MVSITETIWYLTRKVRSAYSGHDFFTVLIKGSTNFSVSIIYSFIFSFENACAIVLTLLHRSINLTTAAILSWLIAA